ncbi:MAG: TonB-dependent receptor plug domain-containing protein [Woeseiaceae bacterium]|nr:TonB-dependent receptor plug domain-containing protein [Woeseiaceae bacterium]
MGGDRVAILIDGVPLSDQFDVGSFSNATRDFLNTGLIERIEVLHGPASALYGSAAIGGVVAQARPDPADVAANGTTRRRPDDHLARRGPTACTAPPGWRSPEIARACCWAAACAAGPRPRPPQPRRPSIFAILRAAPAC